MGLDIYLYRYENKEITVQKENQYEEQSQKNWDARGEYESLNDEQKQSVRAENATFAESLGLNKSGSDEVNKKCIEFDSKKYPEHYFKIGYFRSSYNGGGINRVLKNLGMGDLYEIFNRGDNDEYIFQPDWQMLMIRVKEAIEKLKSLPNLRCFNVGWNEFKGDPSNAQITSEEQALALFMEKAKTFRDDDGFSCSEGDFFPKGIKVFGLISGANKRFFVDQKLPCTYVVIEGENEWYIQALEIIQETIEYVLEQPDKDKFYLHWSS